MKKMNQSSRIKIPTFQSDIVIDEDGEISISFMGHELLHLIDNRVLKQSTLREWKLPPFADSDFISELQNIKHEYSKCTMCPKQCNFDRVKSSHLNCGDWQLRVSNIGISFGDEAEIANGGGSGVILMGGCPLTCPSCINPEKVRSDDNVVTIQEFLLLVEKLYFKGANNIQILSPTVHLPHLRLILTLLKKHSFPLPIILKSSGYESPEELSQLKGLVDIYIPDYKFSTSDFWKKQSGASDYQEVFQQCLKEMYQQVGKIIKSNENIIQRGVIIRHVKNPYLTEAENLFIQHFLSEQPEDIFISILDNFVVLE